MELHFNTPLIRSVTLSRLLEKPIEFKMECFQPSGSFKIRGIGQLCKRAQTMGKMHLISSSGGNAGIATAYAGRKLGMKVSVVVPQTTPESVQNQIAGEGAAVIVHGTVWDEAHQYALSQAEDHDAAYIHPFDHPVIWNGHSTIIDELVQQCSKAPEAIVASVGGGGLFCGIMEGVIRYGWTKTKVLAVETMGANSLSKAVESGHSVTLDSISSVASSLGAKQVADRALQYALTDQVIPKVVSDADAIHACLKFGNDQRVLVEPACGAALSLIYRHSGLLENFDSVVVIVCGGIGVSFKKLKLWQEQFDLGDQFSL